MWDRRPGDWTQETITWFMDGQQYHQVSGARIGNFNVWASLAHNPMYFILNVAVGGSWVSSYLSGTATVPDSYHIWMPKGLGIL